MCQCCLSLHGSRPLAYSNTDLTCETMNSFGYFGKTPRTRAGRPESDCQQNKDFFFPPSRPDRLWGPPIVLSNGYCGLSLEVKLTTHLRPVPRLRMCRDIHPLPQYTFVTWCVIKQWVRPNFMAHILHLILLGRIN
jgi:hypothetical protein